MTDEEALNAALLAFLETAEQDVRHRLSVALRAHDQALMTCSSCAGSGRIQVRHRNSELRRLNDNRVAEAVAPGDEVQCPSCGGLRRDLTQFVWHCSEEGHRPCTPEHPDQNCGWARKLRPEDP